MNAIFYIGFEFRTFVLPINVRQYYKINKLKNEHYYINCSPIIKELSVTTNYFYTNFKKPVYFYTSFTHCKKSKLYLNYST